MAFQLVLVSLNLLLYCVASHKITYFTDTSVSSLLLLSFLTVSLQLSNWTVSIFGWLSNCGSCFWAYFFIISITLSMFTSLWRYLFSVCHKILTCLLVPYFGITAAVAKPLHSSAPYSQTGFNNCCDFSPIN